MLDRKPEIRRRLAKLKLEPTREAAIAEELAQHLDDYYAESLSSGATGRNVLWLVLRQSLTVVVIGIALGLSLAPICTRLLLTFLYGLSTTDPLAIALSVLLLILVVLVACYLPARRATKVDPMIALHCE